MNIRGAHVVEPLNNNQTWECCLIIIERLGGRFHSINFSFDVLEIESCCVMDSPCTEVSL